MDIQKLTLRCVLGQDSYKMGEFNVGLNAGVHLNVDFSPPNMGLIEMSRARLHNSVFCKFLAYLGGDS